MSDEACVYDEENPDDAYMSVKARLRNIQSALYFRYLLYALSPSIVLFVYIVGPEQTLSFIGFGSKSFSTPPLSKILTSILESALIGILAIQIGVLLAIPYDHFLRNPLLKDPAPLLSHKVLEFEGPLIISDLVFISVHSLSVLAISILLKDLRAALISTSFNIWFLLSVLGVVSISGVTKAILNRLKIGPYVS